MHLLGSNGKQDLKKKASKCLVLLGIFSGILTNSPHLAAQDLGDLQRFIGPKDSILITDSQGQILLAKNADEKRIPASVLKIFTSLVALHYLG